MAARFPSSAKKMLARSFLQNFKRQNDSAGAFKIAAVHKENSEGVRPVLPAKISTRLQQKARNPFCQVVTGFFLTASKAFALRHSRNSKTDVCQNKCSC